MHTGKNSCFLGDVSFDLSVFDPDQLLHHIALAAQSLCQPLVNGQHHHIDLLVWRFSGDTILLVMMFTNLVSGGRLPVMTMSPLIRRPPHPLSHPLNATNWWIGLS